MAYPGHSRIGKAAAGAVQGRIGADKGWLEGRRVRISIEVSHARKLSYFFWLDVPPEIPEIYTS